LTGEQILIQAETWTEGDDIDDITGKSLINECLQMDLGKKAMVIDSQVVTISEANTWTAITNNILEILWIEKSDQSYPYYGRRYGQEFDGVFEYRQGYIMFPVTGTFTLWHLRMPNPIANLTETPEVHSALHYPIAMYVAARWKYWDDEENPEYVKLLAQYQAYVGKILDEIRPLLMPTTRKARRVRSGGYY